MSATAALSPTILSTKTLEVTCKRCQPSVSMPSAGSFWTSITRFQFGSEQTDTGTLSLALVSEEAKEQVTLTFIVHQIKHYSGRLGYQIQLDHEPLNVKNMTLRITPNLSKYLLGENNVFIKK